MSRNNHQQTWGNQRLTIKETQYPGWYKDTIGKGLWSGEDKEVAQGNIDLTNNWEDQYTESSVL